LISLETPTLSKRPAHSKARDSECAILEKKEKLFLILKRQNLFSLFFLLFYF